MSDLAKIVKSNIVRLLDEKHISRADLARRMGIAQPQIARMLNGEHELQTDTIQHVAEALDVSPLELFNELVPAS